MDEMRYKIGDELKVTGDRSDLTHFFQSGTKVKVIRVDSTDRTYDVCDNMTGDCYWVHQNDLKFYKTQNQQVMKAMKDACLTVAKKLAKANNTVTTLEIKTELRRDYPYYFWQQQTVSDYMNQFAGDGIFTYTDNGTYRVYSVATPAQVASTTGPVTKSLVTDTTFGKVAGTVPSNPKSTFTVPSTVLQVGTKKRGRPKKTSSNVIDHGTAFLIAGNPAFESVTINGRVIDKTTIKAQKKSPRGYLGTTKLYKVTEIRSNGQTYQVK